METKELVPRPHSDLLLLVALYHFACGVVDVLIFCGLAGLGVLFGTGATFASSRGDAGGSLVAGFVMLMIAGILLLVGIANLAVGWGLWTRREWGRIGGLALGVLRLIKFPIGTLIGGLIIAYLLSPEGKAQFTS